MGRVSLLAMPSRSTRLHPLQCRNHGVGQGRHTQPCGTRLEEAAPYPYRELPAPDHAHLCALQTRIDARLSNRPSEATSRFDATPPTFQDLVDTAQLIKLSWPAARHFVPSPALAELIDNHTRPLHTALQSTPSRTHSGFSVLWSAPQDSAECGALLLTAETLHHDAPDDATLRERIRPLAQYAFENAPPGACRSYFNRSGRSPALARAMARRLQGFYAAGPLEYAALRAPSRDCRFTADEVPSQIPRAWYDTYFTDFADQVPGAGLYTVRHLRRAAALKLVEMTAGGSWRDCARALEIPESNALSTLRKLRRQFGDTSLWPRFDIATGQIARYLDELTQRTNYAHRRRLMANWTMPYDDWTTLSSGLRQADRLTSLHGTVIGTVLVWAEVAQADHLLCPRLEDLRKSATDHRPVIDEIAQFFTPANQRGSRLVLRQRLERYARELGCRIDAGDKLDGLGVT